MRPLTIMLAAVIAVAAMTNNAEATYRQRVFVQQQQYITPAAVLPAPALAPQYGTCGAPQQQLQMQMYQMQLQPQLQFQQYAAPAMQFQPMFLTPGVYAAPGMQFQFRQRGLLRRRGFSFSLGY